MPTRVNRRINRVYLTPEAERVHKRIWRIAEATVDDALAGLGPREVVQLGRLLARVKQQVVGLAEAAPIPARHGVKAQRKSTRRRARALEAEVLS